MQNQNIVDGTSSQWRRKSTKLMALLSTWVLGVVLAVHFFALWRDQVYLPLSAVQDELRAFCPTTPRHVEGGDVVLHVPPAAYGIGVWVDNDAILPTVHDTLYRIDNRLQDSRHDGVQSHIHSFVRWQHQQRDAYCKSQAAPFADVDSAIASLIQVAAKQQLGLPSLKHSFSPNLDQELQMIAISIVTLPAALFPFYADGKGTIRCFRFGTYQAVCLLPHQELSGCEVPRSASASMEREVMAGLSSVLADMLQIRSFADPIELEKWHEDRQVAGCHYAVRSIQNLIDSINGHPDMTIPPTAHKAFEKMRDLVRRGAFVAAARAADDLQFDPLLTPQLFMPWDYSVMSQLSILLPVISMWILGVKFIVEERKADKKKLALQREKKEKKE